MTTNTKHVPHARNYASCVFSPPALKSEERNVFPFSDEEQWGRRLGKRPAGSSNGGMTEGWIQSLFLLYIRRFACVHFTFIIIPREKTGSQCKGNRTEMCMWLGQTAKADPFPETEKLAGKVSSSCFLSGQPENQQRNSAKGVRDKSKTSGLGSLRHQSAGPLEAVWPLPAAWMYPSAIPRGQRNLCWIFMSLKLGRGNVGAQGSIAKAAAMVINFGAWIFFWIIGLKASPVASPCALNCFKFHIGLWMNISLIFFLFLWFFFFQLFSFSISLPLFFLSLSKQSPLDSNFSKKEKKKGNQDRDYLNLANNKPTKPL